MWNFSNDGKTIGNNFHHNFYNITQYDLYCILDRYYFNNGLFEEDTKSLNTPFLWHELMKSIRTPVHRSVEFYVSKIFSNSPAIVAKSEPITQSIAKVLKWSNFDSKGRLAVRDLAKYGDLFLKVCSAENKVYLQIIDPKTVTDFDEDVRGNIIEIRIDTMVEIEEQNYIQTEYWNKDYHAVWIHQKTKTSELEELGSPVTFDAIVEYGIDFVPFVHIKFIDAGRKYGESSTNHALIKIDDANNQAFRLNELLFRYNKPVFGLMANAVDNNGRPMPAPIITKPEDKHSESTDNTVISLPGNSSMESLIPNINYADALAILNASLEEIMQDLPELRYYSIKDGSNMSGKALRSILSGAIDKAVEARSNFVAGMKRVIEMALSVGIGAGIFPTSLGSFENGDFENELKFDEMFSSTLDERAVILKDLVASSMPLETAMKLTNFSIEDIMSTLAAKQRENSTTV